MDDRTIDEQNDSTVDGWMIDRQIDRQTDIEKKEAVNVFRWGRPCSA